MIAGEAQMMFEPMSASIEPVRKGQLRALAVTTTDRSSALPDVPPVAQFVPGYEASAVTGIAAPKGTPPEIIDTLNKAINAALQQPDVADKLRSEGGEVLGGTAEQFSQLLKAEVPRWAKIVKDSGASLD